MAKLSVVIATFHNPDILDECINSIYIYNDIGNDIEIIVSDNSIDGSVNNLIKSKYDNVKYIKNENKGFGWANNRGFELSTGEYILFLNPDTILVEPIFSFAIEQFESNDKLAMFGVKLIDRSGNKVFSYGSMDIYSIFKSIKNRIYLKRNKYIDGKMFTSGADIFIRRDVFNNVGMFDENIFMYLEESDLVHRIKMHGNLQTAYFDNKTIIHLEGATEKLIYTQKIVTQAKRLDISEQYYAQKYGYNYKKILKYRINNAKLKKLYYVLKRDKTNIEQQAKLIELYKNKLRKWQKK